MIDMSEEAIREMKADFDEFVATEFVTRHRPYGLDCKCGEPINSDDGWARHFMREMRKWGDSA